MFDIRISKATFYTELPSGTRPNYQPLLRFKDNFKDSLLSTATDPTTWEDLADNRSKWWKSCITGVQHFEAVRIATAVEKRSWWKGSTSQSVSEAESLQIQDLLLEITIVDNSLQELASLVTWRYTGSRGRPELIHTTGDSIITILFT